MYKALLVALIGLFFSAESFAAYIYSINRVVNGTNSGFYRLVANDWIDSNPALYVSPYFSDITRCYRSGSVYECSTNDSNKRYRFSTPTYTNEQPADICLYNPDHAQCQLPPVYCPDGSKAPDNDKNKCPVPATCPDGSSAPDNDVNKCPKPATCPDGSTAPNNDPSKCPINCDILNGPVDPSCDSENPPDGTCGANQTPIFDNCTYGEDDPRRELSDDEFCEKFPDALSCNPPPFPDLNDPDSPPPAGGTGTGSDTGAPAPTPPAVNDDVPEPTKTDMAKQDYKDVNRGLENRVDNLRYDIAKLHSGLNYQTNTLAKGLTGIGQQLQANGAKTDRSNDLLSGVNKNLEGLNASLKGQGMTGADFDVEGGINGALGITGNEKVSDLTQPKVRLDDYRDDFQPFLDDAACPHEIAIDLNLFGSNFSYDLFYKPVCDFMSIAGTVLNWAVWLTVPFIVFGRRRAS